MHLRDMKYKLACLQGNLDDKAVALCKQNKMDEYAVVAASITLIGALRGLACAMVCETSRTLTEPQVNQIRDILFAMGLSLPE